MLKLLRVVIIIIVALAGLYLVTDVAIRLSLRSETRAMKAAGYATTIAEIVPPATPESREAARLIMAAYDTTLSRADTANPKSRELSIIGVIDTMDYADDPAMFRQIAARYSGSIALMLKAAEYPQVNFPFKYDQGWAMPLDRIPLAIQTGSRLLQAYAKTCFAEGRTDEALKALKAGIHVAAAIRDNFALMMLIRELELREAYTLVRKLAPRLSPEALAGLQSEIEAVDTEGRFKNMLETEMVLVQQAVATNRGWPQADILTYNPVRHFLLSLTPLRNYARRVSMVITRQQVECARRPWYESRADWDRDSNRLGSSPANASWDRVFSLNARRLFIRSEQARAEGEMALLTLKILRYRAAHGRLPDNLEAAAGPMPLDPFSGQPYHYRPGAHEFLLYSVGVSMKDDGGERPRDLRWQVEI